MKIVVLGDTHFGSSYSMGSIHQYRKINTRLLDFSNTFDIVIDYMINNSVSHFIITGDIFEYRRPQASELSIFSEKIRRLEELGICTHIIVGNHDLIREQKATTIDVLKKLKLPRTFIYSDISSVSCSDGNNIMNLIFFPFRTRYMLDCVTNKDAINRLSSMLHYEIEGITNGGVKILIGHLMLQGTKLGNVILEGNAGEVVLPLNMFDNLDGVIMGHIHRYQIIQQDNPFIAYVGSMERKDFGEANVGKYFLSIDYSNGKLNFESKSLSIRELHDITIDQSLVKSSEEVQKNIEEYLMQYSKNHIMFESIVRLTIIINEQVLFNLNKSAIKSFMKEKFKIQYCVGGIHVQIASKKQMRKASITEQNDPLTSFYEYLELEKDDQLREAMKEIGTQIIKEGV